MSSGDRACCACGELIPAEALFCGACGVKDPHREPVVPAGASGAAPEPADVTLTTIGLQEAQPYADADAAPPNVTAGAVVRSPLTPQPSAPPTSTTVIAPAPVAEAPSVARSSSTVPKATVLKTQDQIAGADVRPSGPPSARAASPP
ncbi:MAG: hypothetical protein JKY37_00550, partial [Nannocystaceae bacterium]|nr:hypothetical protein [Nannocystaceae bacterium]